MPDPLARAPADWPARTAGLRQRPVPRPGRAAWVAGSIVTGALVSVWPRGLVAFSVASERPLSR